MIAAVERDRLLLLVTLGGLVVRIVNVLVWRPTCDYDPAVWAARGLTADTGLKQLQTAGSGCMAVNADSVYYYGQGKMLSEGKGYGQVFQWLLLGKWTPSAAHPPVYGVFLALCNKIGLTTVTQQRLASCVVGAIGVYLVGRAAQKVAGRRAALIAAAITAVYPVMWIADGKLLSETFIVPVVALVFIAAYRFWERPRPATAVVMGLSIALAQLTRAELGMLAFVMVIPLAFSLRHRISAKSWMTLGALAIVVTQAAVFPWTLRNLVSFTHPSFGTTGFGTVLLSGNCEAAYYDEENLGLLNFNCLDKSDQALLFQGLDPDQKLLDESEYDQIFRTKALDYIMSHKDRVPVVVAARVGRIWYVYEPGHTAEVNGYFEDRGTGPVKVGMAIYYLLVVPAVYGAVVLWRRKITIVPLVAPFIVVTVTVAITFALDRYRLPADVAMVVLGAVGIDAFVARRFDKRGPEPPAAAGVDVSPGDPAASRVGGAH